MYTRAYANGPCTTSVAMDSVTRFQKKTWPTDSSRDTKSDIFARNCPRGSSALLCWVDSRDAIFTYGTVTAGLSKCNAFPRSYWMHATKTTRSQIAVRRSTKTGLIPSSYLPNQHQNKSVSQNPFRGHARETQIESVLFLCSMNLLTNMNANSRNQHRNQLHACSEHISRETYPEQEWWKNGLKT